jgi:SAM-dependent methyltransferase
MKQDLSRSNGSADPVWENEVYGKGTFVRCPFDQVATFVFRNLPRKPRRDIRILEVGCGPGNNLWFLNQEGFACSGLDASPSAIEYASIRCGKAVELKVAEFPNVPFDGGFDLVIERAAICYVPLDVAKQTIANIHKVLVPGGRFMFTPYSKQVEALGYCLYYTRDMIEDLFRDWKILQLHHMSVDAVLGEKFYSAEWRVWAERV